jgi:hypothetical protein
MSASNGPLVLRLSIAGPGELQGIAADLAGKLAQYSGGPAVARALAQAVARLVDEVAPGEGERNITLEYRSEGGQATVTARSGSKVSEVRLALQG